MPRKRKQSSSGARRARSGSTPAPKRTTARSRVPQGTKHTLDNWLLGLAGLGVLLTGYLTLVAWLGDPPAYCGADSECDLVQSSRWSTLFGMPMALWGLLTYALLAGAVWRLRVRPSAWRATLLIACVGAGVSWFLTLVSVFLIEATCGYCLASFALMNVLLVLVLLRRPSQMPEHAWRKALPFPAGAAIALILGLHLHFSGVFDPAAGPEDPYLKGLATHLHDSGARFYGAYWCPGLPGAEDALRCLRRSAAVRRMYPRGPRWNARGRLPHPEHPGISDVDHRRTALRRGGERRTPRPGVELRRYRACAGHGTGGVDG